MPVFLFSLRFEQFNVRLRAAISKAGELVLNFVLILSIFALVVTFARSFGMAKSPQGRVDTDFMLLYDKGLNYGKENIRGRCPPGRNAGGGGGWQSCF